jgi:predicted metal-dependent peptidase
MTFNLNDHVHRLLITEPFFAALSRRVDKRASTAVPTAGVRVNPDNAQFEMLYNPEYFEGLDDNQRTGVLVHEFYHLVFEHVTNRLPSELAEVVKAKNTRDVPREKLQLFKLFNIAADLSINCMIGAENLPEGCCIPGGEKFEELESFLTTEYYYDYLKKRREEKRKEGGDGEDGEQGDGDLSDELSEGQFDSHDGWGDVDSTTSDIAKERLKDSIKHAAQEAAKGNNWGTVSRDMRKEIMDRLASKVDWRRVLRYFVKTSQKAEKRSTPRRLNNRYPFIHPGKKVRRQSTIAVSIDQSGSVTDSMLAAFFDELNKLADIATFTVVPFDTEVNVKNIFVWKKGENRKRERVMCGGTDFNAPTKYVNGQNFDGHIVLTDMCAPKPVRSKCQRMWMTTTEYAARPYFKTNERVIAIDAG